MPCLQWSKLNHLQLGRFGEYYAKMEFTSYGYEVYTSEVDDHGVDFVVKAPGTSDFYEVQVKSLCHGNYVYISKDDFKIDDRHLVCFLRFKDDKMPDVYLIPSRVWEKPNAVFVDRKYDKPGQTSKPEWGINYSKKNIEILAPYKMGQSLFLWDLTHDPTKIYTGRHPCLNPEGMLGSI